MRRVLVGGALILLVVLGAILAYGVWFVRRAVVQDVKVRATARTVEKAIEIEVVATGSEDGVVITVIDMERSLRDALGLGPPAGFTEAPMQLESREKDDNEAAAYVAKYNLEKVRYAGRLAVEPATPTVLRFAADRPDAASGVIELQHERKIGMGGSISFVSVTVGPPGHQLGALPSSSSPEGSRGPRGERPWR